MKNLGYISKNILSLLLIIGLTVIADYAIGQVFFSAGGGALMIAPAFIELTKPSGCNMAGLAQTAYVIPVQDIETFPTVAGSPSTPAEHVTYIGDFVLKAGKKWYPLYSTKEKGSLMSELDGPTDGKFFRNKVQLFYPSTSAEALGMMYLFKSAEVVVIVKEFSGGGQMRIVGDKDLPAAIVGSENSGAAFGDEKGVTYDIESANCKPAMIYSGAVQLAESPYSYTETDENGTPAQYVSGYENITGWNKDTQTQLWFDVYDNAGTLTLRAYESEANRDLATLEIFSVAVNTDIVIEANTSGYAGNLTVATGIAVNEQMTVVAA